MNFRKMLCAAVLSAAAIVNTFVPVYAQQTSLYESDIDGVDFKVEVEAGRNAKILQLTDPQIIDSSQKRDVDRLNSILDPLWLPNKKEMHYKRYMRQVINNYKPDLILLTGDLIYGEFDDNGENLLDLIDFMDSFRIPWAPVFGNHDNESKMGVDWQCEQLENSKYCLFEQRTLTGNGNYTVGIVQNDALERVFFMMDSNGCAGMKNANNHSRTEVGFGNDQIEWYKATVDTIKTDNPDVKLSFAYHIQNYAFADAFKKYGFTNSDTLNNPINIDNFADRGEDFGYIGRDLKTPWDSNYAVWNSFKEIGVDSVFVGHEHCNSASVVYDGIRVQYGQKSSTYDRANYKTRDGSIIGSYEQGWNKAIIGGSGFELDETDGSIKNAHIEYYQFDDTVGSPDGRENLALGKSVDFIRADGNNENFGAKNGLDLITDGDASTGGSVSGIWVYDTVVDLGAEYLIDTVNVKLNTLHVIGVGYTTYKLGVYLSTDGVNYAQAAMLENPDVGQTTSGSVFERTYYNFTTSFNATAARYIKIKDTVSRHDGNGYSMREIEAYGTNDEGLFLGSAALKVNNGGTYEDAKKLGAGEYRAEQSYFYNSDELKNAYMVMGLYDKLTNRLLAKKAELQQISRGSGTLSAVMNIDEEYVGSGGENLALGKSVRMFYPGTGEDCSPSGSHVVENAVDGDETTYAQATGFWNWGIDIDLGAEYDISTIKLLFDDTGYPINYTLAYSDDAQNWHEIETCDNESGGEKLHMFESVKARYVRLSDNVAQTSIRQMHLCEIEVYSEYKEQTCELRCFAVDADTKEPISGSAMILK